MWERLKLMLMLMLVLIAQVGTRLKRSSLVNDTASAIDNRESTVGVFLDLSRKPLIQSIVLFCSTNLKSILFEDLPLTGSLVISQTGNSSLTLVLLVLSRT